MIPYTLCGLTRRPIGWVNKINLLERTNPARILWTKCGNQSTFLPYHFLIYIFLIIVKKIKIMIIAV